MAIIEKKTSLYPENLRGTFLLVDAASPLVQTALWREGEWIRWSGSREEAGRSLFAGVEEIFKTEQISLEDLNGFFFCEGPGSMLGIRIAAMAIRGWQTVTDQPLPVFAYNSHQLLARILIADAVAPPFHVISDARRQRWNVQSVDREKNFCPFRRLKSEELEKCDGSYFRMEETIRAEPPKPVKKVLVYNLKNHAARFLDENLLRPVENPEPFIGEAPQYQKWNTERHR